MAPKVQLDISAEMTRFDRAIKRAAEKTGAELPAMIRQAGVAFVTAAQKLTPPDRNRTSIRQRSFLDRKGRKVSLYDRGLNLTIFRHRNGLPEVIHPSEKDRLQTGDTLVASVRRVERAKPWKRVFRYDPATAAASGTTIRQMLRYDHGTIDYLRQIHFRGVSRAGWWQSLPALGGRIPADKVAERNFSALLRVGGISSVRENRDIWDYNVRIKNSVRGIQRMLDDFLLAKAYKTAAGRIRFLAKDFLKRVEKAGSEVPF